MTRLEEKQNCRSAIGGAAVFEAVDKVDSLSQKCKHFFEEMQAAASHGAAFPAAPHVCGLSSVFFDAHVAGKNNLI